MKRGNFYGLLLIPLLLAGCQSRRPLLYPNDKVQRVGMATAQQDIDRCMRLADQYLSRGRHLGAASEMATDTAVGGATGAAIGAVGGAVVGDAGRGAAVGAATGATAGLMGSLFGSMRNRQPDPTYANFVTRCLSERGYETIGWE